MLRILITADPELPVPPRLYGGIERIIALLADGLAARGHQVTLVANRESRTNGELVPFTGRSSVSAADTAANTLLIARETRRRRPHVVQSFGRLAYLLPILPLRLPKVMSYQREVTPRSVRWGQRLARGSLHFTACSRRMIDRVRTLGSWRVIYNAVPVDRFQFAREVPGDAPLVFLGRIEHIKGPHLAIEVAKRAGRRLVIAGNVPDDHADYFRQHIVPHVDGKAVTYVGPVDDAAKSDLLAGAAALLMPILWDEPFGIVMAEALACGTPIIGLSRGSLPEIVDQGVTGLACEDVDEMVAAVGRISALNRAACREAADARFSQRALVDAYELLYGQLAG